MKTENITPLYMARFIFMISFVIFLLSACDQVDACLDSGGRWDEVENICMHEKDDVAEKEIDKLQIWRMLQSDRGEGHVENEVEYCSACNLSHKKVAEGDDDPVYRWMVLKPCAEFCEEKGFEIKKSENVEEK